MVRERTVETADGIEVWAAPSPESSPQKRNSPLRRIRNHLNIRRRLSPLKLPEPPPNAMNGVYLVREVKPPAPAPAAPQSTTEDAVSCCFCFSRKPAAYSPGLAEPGEVVRRSTVEVQQQPTRQPGKDGAPRRVISSKVLPSGKMLSNLSPRLKGLARSPFAGMRSVSRSRPGRTTTTNHRRPASEPAPAVAEPRMTIAKSFSVHA